MGKGPKIIDAQAGGADKAGATQTKKEREKKEGPLGATRTRSK